MNEEKRAMCHAIIHSAAGSAAAVSGCSAQIPCADNVALMAIEVGMVIALGKVYGMEITKSAATGIVTGQMGTVFGRCVSQLLVGWIPVAGNIANAITSVSLVEGLGWYVAESFDRKAGMEVYA